MRRWAAGLLALVMLFPLAACTQSPGSGTGEWAAWVPTESLELDYAEQFSVDYYADGYKMITIGEKDQYLLVPENGQPPEGLPEDVTVLYQPLDQLYLVATSAMDLLRAIDGIDNIALSGTDTHGWYIPEAVAAMEQGQILYAGKYNTPDYERILSIGCDLSIQSTMILHNPEVKEQLEQLGVPVLIERSSYERHPLGRMEWVKLYGVLLNKEDLAEAAFQEQVSALAALDDQQPTGQSVAFFFVTANGTVNVRKSGDYVARMIEMAGGEYVFHDLENNGNDLSTMNIQMEDFYAAARDADVLIYNSTIDGEIETIDQLLGKSSLLADFKAVQSGNVWCTSQNLFQESMGIGSLILDMNAILTQTDPETLTYLYKLT